MSLLIRCQLNSDLVHVAHGANSEINLNIEILVITKVVEIAPSKKYANPADVAYSE